MKEDSKIGQFFQEQFADYKEEISLFELEKMTQKMSLNNFTKFSLTTFNVYYAAAIFSGFMISLCLGLHYITTFQKQQRLLEQYQKEFILLKKPTEKENITYTYEPKRELPDSSKQHLNNLYVMPKGKNSLRNSKNSELEGLELLTNESKQNEKTNMDNENPTKQLEQEALPLQTMPITDTTTHMQNIQKPKVVIYKRDTIYEFDTLKVKKKRKKQ
ncbi:MAG: hypothetical protein U0V72_14705 [Cytophagales bacterium]